MDRSIPRGRHAVLLLLMVPAVMAVASCGSGGVPVQSDAPTPTSGTSTRSGQPTETLPSSASTATSTTGFGDAQPAVDVFVRLTSAYNQALQQPASTPASTFDQFVAGQAKMAFEQSLAQEKADGRAFRGTPPLNRVVVISSDLTSVVPSVTLENCVLTSTTDPWTEYVVATGQAVPTTAPSSVPPPYAATIRVFKPNTAGWVVTSYTLDGSKTCTR